MAFLEEMEKFGKKVYKGAKRRGKLATEETKKAIEKEVKSAKGLGSQAAEKLKSMASGGTINKAAQEQMKQVDTSGVKAGKPYSSTPQRWK